MHLLMAGVLAGDMVIMPRQAEALVVEERQRVLAVADWARAEQDTDRDGSVIKKGSLIKDQTGGPGLPVFPVFSYILKNAEYLINISGGQKL